MVYYERNILAALNREIKDLEYFFTALSITGEVLDTETGEILTPSEFFKAETETQTQNTKTENEKSEHQQSRKRNQQRKNRYY